MTAYLEYFNNVELPIYIPESDAGTGGSTMALTPLPWGGQLDGQGDAISPMPGNKLHRKGRVIGLNGPNISGLYEAYRMLRGVRAALIRRNGTGTQHWCWARCIEVKGNWTYENIIHMDIDFEFQMLSPCWYSLTTHNYAAAVGVSDPDDLMTVLAESGTTVLYANHTGDIDQPAAIFTITALGATTLVTINNVTTGYSFSYNGVLASGDVLVIDTGAMSVKNDGVDDYAHFTPPANHEEWMHIAPGDNKFLVTITGGGNLDLVFYAAFA